MRIGFSTIVPVSGRALRAAGLTLLGCTLLAGCAEGNMSDLESYVQQILARKGKRPPPIPPLEPYVVYNYQSAEDRDPFEPFFKDEPPAAPSAAASTSGITPDFNRNREELEQYPLDSLRMMGTLEQNDQIWGIVRSPEGTIHRVQVGNYVGRNHGKIANVSEEGIELTEIVQDGQGGWVERQAALALVEPQ